MLEGADGGEHLFEDIAWHRDLDQMEGDLARMSHHTCPDFDQVTLDAGERPVGNLFRQISQSRRLLAGARMSVSKRAI